jgi:hypothetical protein
MSGDGGRIGSLLLQGITPMLDAPLAGVGGIHPDHADTAAGGHGAQPGAEPAGGDTSNGAAQLLTASAAAQGFAPSRAGIGEIKILDHDRTTAPLPGVVEQGGDRRAPAHPGATPTTQRWRPGGWSAHRSGCRRCPGHRSRGDRR